MTIDHEKVRYAQGTGYTVPDTNASHVSVFTLEAAFLSLENSCCDLVTVFPSNKNLTHLNQGVGDTQYVWLMDVSLPTQTRAQERRWFVHQSDEDEIKLFSDKIIHLRELITSRSAPQEILKEILQAKGK